MSGLAGIMGAFGLSAASGLNAYIPLLMVGLAARFTDWIKLAPPFDALSNEWVLGALVVLLVIEFFADKIPLVDHVNDMIQTFIRPAAGAILFASEANVITQIHPVVALILGLLVAFGVHATKATVRPLVTVGTAGIGNPVVSTVEDMTAFTLSFFAIIAPLVLFFLFIIFGWLLYRFWNGRRSKAVATGGTASGDTKLNWPGP